MKNKVEFVNLGDVNYLTYGGNLVWKRYTEEEMPSHHNYVFNVFRLYTPEDHDLGDDVYLATLHTVDVRDHEKHKKDILYLSGNEHNMDVPWLGLFGGSLEILASEIVSAGYSDGFITYKSNYPTKDDDQISLNEVKAWLTELGIDINEL